MQEVVVQEIAAVPAEVAYGAFALFSVISLGVAFAWFWLWGQVAKLNQCCAQLHTWLEAYLFWEDRQFKKCGCEVDPNDPPPGIPKWP